MTGRVKRFIGNACGASLVFLSEAMKVNLRLGERQLKLDIADERLLGVIEGRETPSLDLDGIQKIVADGLREAVPADISRRRIGILVPDRTRLWVRGDLIIPMVTETLLGLGVPAEAIRIIIALGTHRAVDPAEFPSLVGRAWPETEVINSANRDRGRLVSVGTTSRGTRVEITAEVCACDHLIIFSGVLHHLIAGFGGGRKYILPGVAGYESIQSNHRLALLPDGQPHPLVRPGQLAGNPVHEDMEDCRLLFMQERTATLIAVARNARGELFHIGVGPLDEAFAEACRHVDRACRCPVKDAADFALISAGGRRIDGQLYQATKALFNAAEAVRPGGSILFVAEASEGVGNTEFERMLRAHHHEPEALGEQLSESFSMPTYVACRVASILRCYRVILVSSLSRADTESLGFQFPESIDRCVADLEGRGYVIPFSENVLPVVAS